MIKRTLATARTCGPCMMLKNKIKELGLEVETKDYTVAEDMPFFKLHSIRSVPRLVVDDGVDITIIQGIDDIIAELKKEKDV